MPVTNDKCKERMNDLRKAQNEKIRELDKRLKKVEKKLENDSPSPQPPGVHEGVFFGSAPGGWFGGPVEAVKAIVGSNANLVQWGPLMYNWMPNLLSPFALVGSKNDINYFSNQWLAQMDAATKLADDNGIEIYCHIFDQVGLKDVHGRSARHPFNAANNVHGDLVPGHVYNDCDPAKTQFHNLVERAFKYPQRDPRLAVFHNLLRKYAQNLMVRFPSWTFCTGNELDSRAVDSIVLSWGDNVRAINGDYLYKNESAEQLLADPMKRVMFANLQYLEFHHCGPLDAHPAMNVKHHYATFERIKQDFPHLKMIASSDGVGTGIERGKNGRPTFEQERETLAWLRTKDGYAKWIGKTGISENPIEDTREYIRRVF